MFNRNLATSLMKHRLLLLLREKSENFRSKMLENSSTKSDLELFTREITWDTRPTISKFYSPAIFATLGFAFAAGINYFQRKPFLSGIFIVIMKTVC